MSPYYFEKIKHVDMKAWISVNELDPIYKDSCYGLSKQTIADTSGIYTNIEN